MNKGLKNYTKHLTHTIGSAIADFNLFERDANMHITIPLLSTKGLNPFGTNLIFNYQDKNVFNDMFGYGFKLNHYAKITATLTTVTVENADGSEDTYEFDQWNPETQMKVSKVYSGEYNDSPNYEFEDRDGNKIIYESLSEYPSRIQMKSGDSINFSFIGSTKTISNGKGDKITFSPDGNGRIGSVIYSYGPTNEYYEFYYTWDNLIQDIYFVPDGGVGLHRFYYSYDAKTRLLDHIEDANGNTLIAYEYDSEGKVIKSTQQNNSILEYSYDNLGNINSLLRKIQNKFVHESYVNATRSQSSHPEILVENLGDGNYFGVFNGDANLKNNGTSLAPIGTNFSFGKEGQLPYIAMNPANSLAYNLPEQTDGSYENGCVQFWFKPNEVGRIQYLFGIQGSTGHYLTVYCEEEQLHVEVKERNKEPRRILYSVGRVLENKWNFFALDFYFRSDEGASSNGEIILRLNNETRVFTMNGTLLNMDLTCTQRYYIGRRYDGVSNEAFTGKIACLSIAPRTYCRLDTMNTFYNITKDFIDDCRYIDSYEETVDISETVAFMPSSTTYNSFEIFPLNNNMVSIKGKRPIKFTQRRGVVEDKDKSFNFNPIIKRYAYVADGSELVYSFGQHNSGTILMRAYTEASNNAQYLLEGKDAYGRTISLRKDASNYLRVDCDQYENRSTLVMSTGEWHTVGLSFQKIVTGDSESEEISGKVRVFLDGQVHEMEVPIDFNTLEFSIGRRFDAESVFYYMGTHKESYPFYGQIEMLCANNAYNTTTTLNKLMQEIKPITKTNEFDDFGRVKHSCVIKGDTKLIDKSITYANRPGDSRYTSERVVDEDFMVFSNSGSGGFNRSYTYDNLGNVTAILDNTIGSHTYEYDDRGFLVRDDNTTFAYDGNGNITQRGSSFLIYDSVIKDKLVEVGGEPIEYSEIDPLLPTAFDGYYYSYEGKRLVAFTDALQHADYTYEYNDQGQRIRKSTPDGLVKYIYNGNKLIAEIAPWHTLNFLYDENDQLYGFDIDGTGTYFYLRDSLQNILGIIDSTGDLVVKYNYTAYGECTITYNSEGIAEINPFRYKGYYYDSESGMYYCNSRYYVPAWCRWLTPDSPSFLQPESLNGMNLFAYCGNDPVNKYDPMGRFWDYVFDAAFIAWGVYDIVNGGYSDWKNWVALGVDVAFAVLPFVPSGVGQVIKVGNKIDNAIDVANAINKIDNLQDVSKLTFIGRNMDRVTGTASLIGKSDNLYKMWKGYDSSATGFTRIVHNGISMTHDAMWLLGKLRKGYTVVDIGITTAHTGFGLWYGAERIVTSLWTTRNIWKVLINYFS